MEDKIAKSFHEILGALPEPLRPVAEMLYKDLWKRIFSVSVDPVCRASDGRSFIAVGLSPNFDNSRFISVCVLASNDDEESDGVGKWHILARSDVEEYGMAFSKPRNETSSEEVVQTVSKYFLMEKPS